MTRSIILRDHEVRAALDTGRVLVVRPVKLREFGRSDTKGYDWTFRDKQMLWHDFKDGRFIASKHNPLGAPGETRWVREAWGGDDLCGVAYRVDHLDWPSFRGDGEQPDGPWLSAARMPRHFSRLTVRVAEARVQRLRHVTAAEAVHAGAAEVLMPEHPLHRQAYDEHGEWVHGREGDGRFCGSVGAFQTMWDHRYARRGLGWDAEPWCWFGMMEVVQ